jgi:hypothetical protein
MNISMREAEVAARAELELAMKTPDLATIAAAVSKMQAIDASEVLIQEGLAFVRALHVSFAPSSLTSPLFNPPIYQFELILII